MSPADIALLVTAVSGALFGGIGLYRAYHADRRAAAGEKVAGRVAEFEALVAGFDRMFEQHRAEIDRLQRRSEDCEKREASIVRRLRELEDKMP